MTSPIRINPLDLTPSRAIGVSIPFNGPAVFNSTYTTKDQIKSNLLNFFLTNQGERVFNPFFGANLRKSIFEQLSSNLTDNINNIIRSALEIYFPLIDVQELKLTPYPDSNSLEIYFSYSVSETNINDQITIRFQQ